MMLLWSAPLISSPVAVAGQSGRAGRWGSRGWRQALSSWSLSALLHAALIVLLALWVVAVQEEAIGPKIVARLIDPNEAPDDGAPLTLTPDEEPMPLTEVLPAEALSTTTPRLVDPDQPVNPTVTVAPSLVEAVLNSRQMLTRVDLPAAGSLAGRSPEAKGQWLRRHGGTPQSEEAVRRGLRWLQAHQLRDGSWRFDHRGGQCQGQCRDPGNHASSAAATSLALLAYLGAGQTPQQGEYTETVRLGLYYLLGRVRQTAHGADLQEGTMYAQGLSTIALCEGFALTGDARLGAAAQQALNFIVYAQDRRGGGWRYAPGQPGDTTVTGWQVMALKSGRLAHLGVPTLSLMDAGRFLDSVQGKSGATYGYQEPGAEPTTSAVGLLCRMMLGWPRNHPALERGVLLLSARGPAQDNMYYNYYATQVLLHYGGYEWEKWNAVMREYLIRSQGRDGHESGSWYTTGGHVEAGGRLLVTTLAIMTLEVYYRYLPLYQADRFDDDL